MGRKPKPTPAEPPQDAQDAEKVVAQGTVGQLQKALGWDVPRIWATGVQIFSNPEYVLFVLQEQTEVEPVEPPEGMPPVLTLARNVGSFVLPVEVARRFKKIMNELDFGPDAPE